MTTSIHPTAVVETDDLGAGCRVQEYATVGAGAVLSRDVSVGAGARLVGSVRVDRAVTIGPNAVLGDVGAGSMDGIVVGREATIGANATVRAGVAIGRGAVVEPGAVVESDVPAHAVVRGSPAHIVGYVDTMPEPAEPEALDSAALSGPTATAIPGVVLHPVTHARDLRGSLAVLEFASLPFMPQRVFAVYDVPSESVRGAHAHRSCGQLLVCVSGEVSCVADDGASRQGFRLTNPEVGLYIPPLVWSMQYRYSSDAVLMVLAELPYDPDDYVRDYEEFLELLAAR